MAKYLTVLGGVRAELWDTDICEGQVQTDSVLDMSGMLTTDALLWAMDRDVVPCGSFEFDDNTPCPVGEQAQDDFIIDGELLWVEVVDSTRWDIFVSAHQEAGREPVLTMCAPERQEKSV